MSGYVKPVVLKNESLAEDVWATDLSSGLPIGDCWTVNVYRSQEPYEEAGRYIHVFRVSGVHGDCEHISLATLTEIVFDDNLDSFHSENDTGGVEVDGLSWSSSFCGNVGLVKRVNHANAYTSSDNFDYCIKAYTMSPNLNVVSWSYTCEMSVNVNGGGVGGK